MSTIKVDTIATRTGSGNITVSNNIAGGGTISGTNLSASGTLAVTGNTTVGGTLVNTGLITASAGVATNSITAQSGTDITIPTGKKLVVTDTGGVQLPGAVVQVVRGLQHNPSSTQTASTAYVAVNSAPTVSITPKFANSLIMVCCGGPIAHFNVGSNYGPVYNIGRTIGGGSVVMVDTTGPLHGIYKNNQDAGHWEDHIVHWTWCDDPSYSLGQALTYRMYGRKTNSGVDTWLNHHGGIGSLGPGSSSLWTICMEIAQ